MSAGNDKVHLILRRGRLVLALLGLVLALFGTGSMLPPHEDDEVLVWVNHQPVTVAQLAFAEERLTGGSSDKLSATQRRSIINLLIDQELLLQRAESLGTYAANPGVRKAIVQAVIDRVVEDFRAHAVEPRQLKQFYQEHRAVFERPARVAIQALRFENLRDAEQAHAAVLAGMGFAEIGQTTTARAVTHLPSSLLPVHMLRRYLGVALTDVALTLEQGETSRPVTNPDGVYLLQARAVQPSEVPGYEDVRAEVEAEYQFRGREKALENALAKFWRSADIDINQEVAGGLAVPGKYDRGLSDLIGFNTEPGGGL